MTDEQMDARLRRAGETWRAAQGDTPAGEPDEPMDITPRTRPRRFSRTGYLLTAAAVAAALAGGLAVVVTSLGGNGQQKSADVAGLEGTVWRLVSYGNEQPDPKSTATMVFNADGTFVADDSCTVLGGSYDVAHGQLFTEPHDSRLKQCVDAAGDEIIGDRGVEVLTAAPAYTVDGTSLTIRGDGQVMHLEAAPGLPRPTTDVPAAEGATWVLTGVRDGNNLEHPVQGTPTFVIKNDELTASDSCNTLSGEAVVLDGTLTTSKGGGLRVTEIGCAQEVMATAAVVDAVLNANPTVSVAGATLTVKHPGAGTLSYTWQPDDETGTNPALLESRSWALTSVDGHPATAGVTLRVSSPDDISGNDGCQAFTTAGNEVGRGTLRLGAAPKPLAGCGNPDATSFDVFLAQQPALWAIRDGRLLIFGGGAQGLSLVFTPSEPVPSSSATPTPVGKAWALSELSSEGSNSGGGSATSASGVVLTIATNDFHLRTPCGNWDGGAYEKGDTITFDPVHDAGGPYCLNGEFGKAADRLVHGGSAKWSIKGGRLELVQGHVTLTFDG